MAPEDRRRQLLDTARSLIADVGFDGLTVEAVARAADVTRPVVYDLFGDLDGLVIALIDREQQIALSPLLSIISSGAPQHETPEEFIGRALGAFLQAVQDDRETWQLVLMPPQRVSRGVRRRFTASRELIADRIARIAEWALAERGAGIVLDYGLIGRLVVAAGEDGARLTLMHPRRYRPERLVVAATTALALLPERAEPHGSRAPRIPVPTAPRTEPRPPGVRMPIADRREQLLDVALELIDEQDWDALSMDAIAKRAGVDRKVVYRCYPRLELLTIALLHRAEQSTRDLVTTVLPDGTIPTTPAEVFGGAVARLLDEVLAQPLTYRVALRRPESLPRSLRKIVDSRRAAAAKRLRPLVELGLASVDGPTRDVDVELLSRLLLTAGEELARLALHEPDYPPQRVLDGAWALLDAVPTR
jgi:AcrR family transcriptional regulator